MMVNPVVRYPCTTTSNLVQSDGIDYAGEIVISEEILKIETHAIMYNL